jgi:hypothetical protein
MSLQSTLGVARPGTKSLRATVPEGIVAFMEFNEGDQLDWRMEVDEKGERYLTVRKLKSTEEEAVRIAEKYTKRKHK